MGGYTAEGRSPGEPWGGRGRPGERWPALGGQGSPGEPGELYTLPAVAGRRNTTPSANPSPAKLWVN